jgi:hypothetical protein
MDQPKREGVCVCGGHENKCPALGRSLRLGQELLAKAEAGAVRFAKYSFLRPSAPSLMPSGWPNRSWRELTNDSEELMFDLDPIEFEFSCPRCDFSNPITFREARLGAPTICRGCKNTVVPDDVMGELENARRRIADSIREFEDHMKRLGA